MESLHEELRKAREKAGLSQQALARLAGIPRNQVVRAERGENITVDTLRKIAAHLPVTQLTLLDTAAFRVDIIAEPEKILFGAIQNVMHLTEALRTAIQLAIDAAAAADAAHRAAPLPEGAEPILRPDPFLLLRGLQRVVGEIEAIAKDGPPTM